MNNQSDKTLPDESGVPNEVNDGPDRNMQAKMPSTLQGLAQTDLELNISISGLSSVPDSIRTSSGYGVRTRDKFLHWSKYEFSKLTKRLFVISLLPDSLHLPIEPQDQLKIDQNYIDTVFKVIDYFRGFIIDVPRVPGPWSKRQLTKIENAGMNIYDIYAEMSTLDVKEDARELYDVFSDLADKDDGIVIAGEENKGAEVTTRWYRNVFCSLNELEYNVNQFFHTTEQRLWTRDFDMYYDFASLLLRNRFQVVQPLPRQLDYTHWHTKRIFPKEPLMDLIFGEGNFMLVRPYVMAIGEMINQYVTLTPKNATRTVEEILAAANVNVNQLGDGITFVNNMSAILGSNAYRLMILKRMFGANIGISITVQTEIFDLAILISSFVYHFFPRGMLTVQSTYSLNNYLVKQFLLPVISLPGRGYRAGNVDALETLIARYPISHIDSGVVDLLGEIKKSNLGHIIPVQLATFLNSFSDDLQIGSSANPLYTLPVNMRNLSGSNQDFEFAHTGGKHFDHSKDYIDMWTSFTSMYNWMFTLPETLTLGSNKVQFRKLRAIMALLKNNGYQITSMHRMASLVMERMCVYNHTPQSRVLVQTEEDAIPQPTQGAVILTLGHLDMLSAIMLLNHFDTSYLAPTLKHVTDTWYDREWACWALEVWEFVNDMAHPNHWTKLHIVDKWNQYLPKRSDMLGNLLTLTQEAAFGRNFSMPHIDRLPKEYRILTSMINYVRAWIHDRPNDFGVMDEYLIRGASANKVRPPLGSVSEIQIDSSASITTNLREMFAMAQSQTLNDYILTNIQNGNAILVRNLVNYNYSFYEITPDQIMPEDMIVFNDSLTNFKQNKVLIQFRMRDSEILRDNWRRPLPLLPFVVPTKVPEIFKMNVNPKPFILEQIRFMQVLRSGHIVIEMTDKQFPVIATKESTVNTDKLEYHI